MKSISLLAFWSVMAISPYGMAADNNDHRQHHPEDPVATKVVQKTAPGMPSEKMAAMDAQMKAMRGMHEKMMAAKTPEERKALMADHMKAMQDGMSMMNGMRMDKEGMSPQMMHKRMDMMQTMMQMMMDHMAMQPMPGK